MVDQDILFVFGAARSGTKYTSSLLRSFFDYGICGEGQFVPRIGKRLRKYGDLNVDRNLHRLIDDVLRAQMVSHFRDVWSQRMGWPMSVTFEDVVRNLPERSYPGVIYAVFLTVAQQFRQKRVGNTFPGFSSHLPQLFDWFPRAKFLHVIRDGRDVALSLMTIGRRRNSSWGERNVFACGRNWVHVQEDAHRFRSVVPAAQYHELYYERLLENPEQVIPELEQFLKAPLDLATREKAIDSVRENDKRWNFGKWREQMSPSQLRIYESTAGHWLQQHGYPLVCDNPTSSSLERAIYTAHMMGYRLQRDCSPRRVGNDLLRRIGAVLRTESEP